MAKAAHPLKVSPGSIFVPDLSLHAQGWLLDSEVRRLSKQTLYSRKSIVDKLLKFLNQRGLKQCGVNELRAFLAYVTNGHLEAGGRWGNEYETDPVRPSTVHTHYSRLKTLFAWLVDEGAIETTPFERLSPPMCRPDQIQPFTMEQVAAIRNAAQQGDHAKRDDAIILLLLDTGLRATELCELRVKDVDMQTRQCKVHGKGDKHRVLSFGVATTRALWGYLRAMDASQGDDVETDAPLFLTERGPAHGKGFTRSGLLQMIARHGKSAKIEVARCSPHTFRHTFAVEFLRNGGNSFTLMQILGHTNMAMTQRYVAIAQSDIRNQHKQFSPVDRLKRKAG